MNTPWGQRTIGFRFSRSKMIRFMADGICKRIADVELESLGCFLVFKPKNEDIMNGIYIQLCPKREMVS